MIFRTDAEHVKDADLAIHADGDIETPAPLVAQSHPGRAVAGGGDIARRSPGNHVALSAVIIIQRVFAAAAADTKDGIVDHHAFDLDMKRKADAERRSELDAAADLAQCFVEDADRSDELREIDSHRQLRQEVGRAALGDGFDGCGGGIEQSPAGMRHALGRLEPPGDLGERSALSPLDEELDGGENELNQIERGLRGGVGDGPPDILEMTVPATDPSDALPALDIDVDVELELGAEKKSRFGVRSATPEADRAVVGAVSDIQLVVVHARPPAGAAKSDDERAVDMDVKNPGKRAEMRVQDRKVVFFEHRGSRAAGVAETVDQTDHRPVPAGQTLTGIEIRAH